MSNVLITNNKTGNHDPSQWAAVSAAQIADASALSGEQLAAAQELQRAITHVLVKPHTAVQENERQLLLDPQHAVKPLGHGHNLEFDPLIDDISMAAIGTRWETHFASPEVRPAIAEVIQSHLHSSMHVERLAHADAHPDCVYAQSYKGAA